MEEAIEIVGKDAMEEFLSYHVINEAVRFDNLPEGENMFTTISGLPIVLRGATSPPRGFVLDGTGGEIIVNLGAVEFKNGVSYLTSRILAPRPI